MLKYIIKYFVFATIFFIIIDAIPFIFTIHEFLYKNGSFWWVIFYFILGVLFIYPPMLICALEEYRKDKYYNKKFSWK